MPDIDTLRLVVGDRVKKAVNETIGEGDGANNHFQLDMYPLPEPATAHVVILLTGSTASTSTITISGAVGCLTFSTGNEPSNGDTLLGTYDYVALTTAEMTDILSGHTGSPYLAAANAASIIAADSSRLFMYTMGDKTVDKRRVARSLMELSAQLENRHYRMRDDGKFAAKVVTYDDSGTVYKGYDSAVASYLTATS